ncbi:gluconokinase [Chelativorans salis]|uniref:Gluconokinase n=1 Tax=Chelativorans salis TaxID=2978478 RepID=A0ABT2LVW6_9HYPH|nr:gluconokinase [Chelativorans sp. EGI FJ00035]MCT7378012.1 gluconokinase [Chelativorans sp. EGI FJ00035]
MANKAKGIVVMGVAGSGKSSLGALVARALACPFLEGDQFHPPENIAKMSAGIALEDGDRWPWLDRLGHGLSEAAGETGLAVAACSALRRAYRQRLRVRAGIPLGFIFLKGARSLILSRMEKRTGHYMPISLLDSQFATLEEPQGEPHTLTLDIARPVDALMHDALPWAKAFNNTA